MDSVVTNGITSMEWSILFYLMELNKVVEHICAHFSLGRNMVDCQSYVKQKTKFMIRVRCWLLYCYLSIVDHVKLRAFLRVVISVFCECCTPNQLLTIAPGVINFGLL
jgi:hypothetical protein